MYAVNEWTRLVAFIYLLFGASSVAIMLGQWSKRPGGNASWYRSLNIIFSSDVLICSLLNAVSLIH